MRLIIEYPKLLPDALQQTPEEFEHVNMVFLVEGD
jgi:hypothetical protein